MSPNIDPNAVKFRPSAHDKPRLDLRYMHRRRVNTTDRNGDPLDGVANLFTVVIVLALGFLLATLTGLGLSDVLTKKDMTIVTDPGSQDMQVLVRHNGTLQKLNLQPGQQVSGLGTLIGQLYRLQDGTTIYVPTGPATPAPGAAGLSSPTPTPAAATPAATPTAGAASPTTLTPTPTPSGTISTRG
jgi:hypothetical protein